MTIAPEGIEQRDLYSQMVGCTGSGPAAGG